MAFFETDGVKLYFETYGKGEPLLIVAGGGADSRYYSSLSAILENDFQVIIMDPRGSGQSERGSQEYSFDLLVSDLIKLLDHLHLDKVSILGHSMGGMTAQYFACQYPERINKLVLWATASLLSAFGKHCCKTAELIKSEGSLKAFIHVMSIWNFSDAFFENEANFHGLLSRAEQDPYPLSTEAFIEQMKIINIFDCTERLHEINLPTLVIGCEKDIIFPTDGAKKLASLIKNATYQEISNATHSVHIELPEKVAEIVKLYITN